MKMNKRTKDVVLRCYFIIFCTYIDMFYSYNKERKAFKHAGVKLLLFFEEYFVFRRCYPKVSEIRH